MTSNKIQQKCCALSQKLSKRFDLGTDRKIKMLAPNIVI